MWIVAFYTPTALFSLRPASSTSSGGKTLLVPTPFAIKMALLDVAIRTQGLEQARTQFSTIKGLQIAVRLGSQIVVNKTFTKILRLKEIKTKASEKDAAITKAKSERNWPFQKTIAYREYIQFTDDIGLAIEGSNVEQILPLLMQLNYLGKRGGFIQLRCVPETFSELPSDFTRLTEGVNGTFLLGTLQVLDDWGEKMTFDHANVFHQKAPITANKERIFRHIIIPYRPIQSSRSFTLYERLPA